MQIRNGHVCPGPEHRCGGLPRGSPGKIRARPHRQAVFMPRLHNSLFPIRLHWCRELVIEPVRLLQSGALERGHRGKAAGFLGQIEAGVPDLPFLHDPAGRSSRRATILLSKESSHAWTPSPRVPVPCRAARLGHRAADGFVVQFPQNRPRGDRASSCPASRHRLVPLAGTSLSSRRVPLCKRCRSTIHRGVLDPGQSARAPRAPAGRSCARVGGRCARGGRQHARAEASRTPTSPHRRRRVRFIGHSPWSASPRDPARRGRRTARP